MGSNFVDKEKRGYYYGNREKPYYKKREDLKYNKYNPKRQEEDSSSSILNKIKFM